MRYAWLTDIHLDFIDNSREPSSIRKGFAEPLSQIQCDGYFVTGDISLAPDVVRHLKEVDACINKPMYFVCGNHDFYGGDFGSVRARLKELCATSKNLRYMTTSEYLPLTDRTAIVGHDGWYDVQHGDPNQSKFLMSDWVRILDYSKHNLLSETPDGLKVDAGKVVKLSRKFAAAAADHIKKQLTAAVAVHSEIVVLTHVPPYPQVHVDNKKGHPGMMPWYTSKAIGDVISSVAAAHPAKRFNVFCGHTHGQASVQIAHNVYCYVGGAEYGNPSVAGLVNVL